MLGKIVSIIGDMVKIKLEINIYELDNLMGKNVIFEFVSKLRQQRELSQREIIENLQALSYL